MSNSAGPKITKDGLVLDFDAANPKSYNFYADPYASNVILYLQMNGANGSTTFTDSSPNALTVTPVGNAQISTTQSKYGGASAYFYTNSAINGLGNYIKINNPNTVFGSISGDFTIETWVYFTTAPPGNADGYENQLIGQSTWPESNSGNWWGFYAVSTGLYFYAAGGGSFILTQSATFTWSTGRWYHVAAVRQNGNLSLYLDGVQTGTTTSVTKTIFADNSRPLAIAADSTGGKQAMDGYLDHLRITKYARYTSAFTSPPIPSTCTDLTRSKNVGTLTGGVDYNFSNGGSLVFDGSNDYVNIPASTNLTFGTGDFTMEVWFKTRAKTMLYPALLSVNLAWAANVWVLIDRHNVTAPTKFTFHVYNIASPTLTSVTAPSNGVWYNVVVTRIGTLFSMYVNGVLESTATSSASIDGGVSNSINLGRQFTSDSTYYDGNIPLARIYKARGLTSAEVYNNFVANRGRFGV